MRSGPNNRINSATKACPNAKVADDRSMMAVAMMAADDSELGDEVTIDDDDSDRQCRKVRHAQLLSRKTA